MVCLKVTDDTALRGRYQKRSVTVFKADQHELSPDCWVTHDGQTGGKADGRTLEAVLTSPVGFPCLGNERECEPNTRAPTPGSVGNESRVSGSPGGWFTVLLGWDGW